MTTHRYFHISQGLRGCYMPDNSYVIMCTTRRELKDALEGEAATLRDCEMVGLSKANVAAIAAAAWREAHKPRPSIYDFVVSYRNKGQSGYPYGIFASVATRADYLEYQRDCDD